MPSLHMTDSATQGTFRNVLRTITDREWKADIIVFIAYFATAKLAQYILFTLQTSPALLWAPTGIALAAVLLKGNKMWVPIALGYIAAILTLPGYLPLENKLIAAVGFTIQPLIGAYLFRRMGSNGTLHRSRDVIILMSGAAVTAAIGPLFNTFGQAILGGLAETMLITFSRAWAGGLLGIIVMTPLIAGWYYSPTWPIKRQQLAEAVSAFGFLTLAIYALFWTSFPSVVFALIFFLCAILFWISFRFGSRVNTTAILFLTVFGILGSIVAHPTPTPLNTQLFADELFILLIAPIFLQFFVLAEERRQAEQRLKDKVAELERMTGQLAANDSAKNEFIAILAHELRNPLSTVVSTLELLKLESKDANMSPMIGRAEQQTLSMRRLLDDLLDVARIEEKKFDIIKEATDVCAVVRRAVDTTEEIVREKRHTMSVSLPEEKIFMDIDSVRIEQVVTNLLTNAVKYTPEGGVISVHGLVEADAVVIRVVDDGKGIPAEFLERIFLPFQQLGSAPHRASGIGIGLFLTRQIVEHHGGTVTAESNGAGKGSTFTVRLPYCAATAPSAAQKIRTPQAPSGAVHMRTLVVDDNEAAAVGMSRLLEHHGHTVRTAHNGQSALSAFHDFVPDVVLLDIGLPDMSGHEVASKIRSHGGRQPILIALTGYGQESDKNDAIVSGFNHHLTKPVSIVEVIEILNQR